jgi:hypothetical protein
MVLKTSHVSCKAHRGPKMVYKFFHKYFWKTEPNLNICRILFTSFDRSVIIIKYRLQIKVTEIKFNTILKGTFEECNVIHRADNSIQFWKLLPYEHFPNFRKFAQWSVILRELISVNRPFHKRNKLRANSDLDLRIVTLKPGDFCNGRIINRCWQIAWVATNTKDSIILAIYSYKLLNLSLKKNVHVLIHLTHNQCKWHLCLGESSACYLQGWVELW